MVGIFSYFLFNTLSIVGINLYLCFVSLKLLQREYGGTLGALVLGMEAIFAIFIGPYCAKYIDAIPVLAERLRRAFSLQFALIVAAFLPFIVATYFPENTWGLLLSLALIQFLLLIDTQLKSTLPLSLEKRGKVPLFQTLSLWTLSQRSIVWMSSTLAPLILSCSWLIASALNSSSYIFALLALFTVLRVLGLKTPSPPERGVEGMSQQKQQKQIPSSSKKPHNEQWVKWYWAFLFLTNLTYGPVLLIMTKSMLLTHEEGWVAQVMQGPAPIYIGLLISLIIMIFFPIKSSSYASSARHITLLALLVSTSLFLIALPLPTIRPVLLLISGILNGFSMVGNQAFVQRNFAAEHFVDAFAKSSALQKMGGLVTLIIAGVGMDYGFTTGQLLLGCGILGIITSLFFFVFLGNLHVVSKEETIPLS